MFMVTGIIITQEIQKIYNAKNLFTDLSLFGWNNISAAKRKPCSVPNTQMSKRMFSENELVGIFAAAIR